METYNSDNGAKPKSNLFIQNQDHSIFEDYFVPDTTINNFVLRSKTGLFRDMHGFSDSLNGGNGPDSYFLLVSNQNQICKLVFYPGGYTDEFPYFEVYHGSPSDVKGLKFKRIATDQFITESGIHWGLTKEELLEIKGMSYSNELSTENEIIFSFDSNSELQDFLREKNEAGYIAKYLFANNKLIKFGFRFIYP